MLVPHPDDLLGGLRLVPQRCMALLEYCTRTHGVVMKHRASYKACMLHSTTCCTCKEGPGHMQAGVAEIPLVAFSLTSCSVWFAGKAYPLEMHIVNYVYNDTLPSCGPKGCITVVGILFELDESDAAEGNSFIDTVFKAMPYNEEETSQLVSHTSDIVVNVTLRPTVGLLLVCVFVIEVALQIEDMQSILYAKVAHRACSNAAAT